MPNKKKYTIADIARELNTTSSTISRALQDSPRISVKMRQAAQELARVHNYEPDFRASSLRKGSGNIIGILVPRVNRHFFSTVLSGIDEVATKAGYSVLICQTFESYEKEQQLVKNLMHGRVDGIISSISIETKKFKHFEQVIAKGLPLVFFDRVCETLNTSKVLVDDYQGACVTVNHLIDNGCRRIAHLAGPQHLNIYRERTRGYTDTLINNNFSVDDSLIFPESITREAGYAAMQQILAMTPMPDAIFCSGDYSALGAILCAREAGVNIPEQICITGFANEPWVSFIDPPVTSVDQHAFETGKQAATLLLQQIESNEQEYVPRTVVLNPQLVIRKSSQKIIIPTPFQK
jgi:LacI family transcriptional regulator